MTDPYELLTRLFWANGKYDWLSVLRDSLTPRVELDDRAASWLFTEEAVSSDWLVSAWRAHGATDNKEASR